MADKGFIGAVNSGVSQRGNFVTKQEFNDFTAKFVKARVVNIIYDENSPNFKNQGQWNGLGTIEYQLVNFQGPSRKSRGFAKPMYGNIIQYPLKNEIVFLFKLPDAGVNTDPSSESYYYINPVSVWNHPHHNAMPNPIQDAPLDPGQQNDYSQVEGGSVRRVSDGSTEIDLNGDSGGTFVERTDIHPLMPYSGDVIVEGRFGNSIRLGNTSKTDSTYKNEYSDVGNNGDPITIIRNGQPSDASDKGWLPISESVNLDKSSMYLTSTQKIPINLSNEDYSAFDNPPTNAQEYTENQIVLNSGRLLFNSKQSDVIVSSGNKVAIQSIDTMGLASDADITLSTPDLRLGNKSADQQLVLGNDFMVQFEALVQGISNLCDKLKTSQNWPGGAAVPNVPLIGVAINTKVTAEAILNNIKKGVLLSKASRTI